MRVAKLKTCLLLLLEVWSVETNQQEIMGWESSVVFRFDLGPLLQGHTRIAKLKSAYNLQPHLLLVLKVSNVKPTYGKSWADNLPMCSDLTLGLSFKVIRV